MSSATTKSKAYAPRPSYFSIPSLETVAAWLLAIIWIFPLLYAFWAAFHPPAYMVRFDLFAPLTLDNFKNAWAQAPFARYYLNTFTLVTGVVLAQFVVCTLAAFAFARFPIPGKNVLFMLVLIQLFVFPEVLIVENYRIASELGLINTITGIGLPYVASAFGIFLLRQTFKTIPRELEDAARIEGCNWLEILWKVYVPLAKPTYLAYGLVSISHHWNNFLWPLVVTNSVESRPLTVGLGVFSAPETGVNWATVSAATLLSIAPLLIAFLLFQRQFVQSFLRAGIR
ncbi:MAG: carbohydrate ABC transporter permease [Halomonas sp.]|nr:carbohydrate ABC transporter permease [Halomonas sp.]TVP42576.1 MAG: carbohydrate ABC transporter permease [Halomonas sp.]